MQMKLASLATVVLVTLTMMFCRNTTQTNASSSNAAARVTEQAQPVSSDELQCLVEAYPDFLSSGEGNTLHWKDGSSMVFDDGQVKKDFDTLLDRANLKDQMSICYPLGDRSTAPPAVNYDPGRIRYEPFFLKMYGNSPEEVRRKLVPVMWLPKHLHKVVMVTTVNGIDQKLKAASDELDSLPDEYSKYLENPGGTFNWRPIAGTNRLSTHSFGSTIDINVRLSDYWRNARPNSKGLYEYKNRIPMKIVEIMEKHGFIWGGKWYHYDTMHFEYRPELLSEKCTCR
jgi:peptidoglycan L-alanyl-D-glutamate endopeptidase CwlK